VIPKDCWCAPAARPELAPWVLPQPVEAGAERDSAGVGRFSIEPARVYRADDARAFLAGQGIDVDTIAPLVDGRFFSGFIRARKPSR